MIVTYGSNISSIKYNDRTDGKAVSIRIIMGAAVHAASNCSTSSVGSLWVTVAVIAVIAKVRTTSVMRQVSRSTWSCKKITSSIVGPVASCSESWVAYGTRGHKMLLFGHDKAT